MKKVIFIFVFSILLTGCENKNDTDTMNSTKENENNEIASEEQTTENTTTDEQWADTPVMKALMDGMKQSSKNDEGHITVTSGEIINMTIYEGQYRIVLGKIIDDVCYMDSYSIEKDEWNNLEMGDQYTVKE